MSHVSELALRKLKERMQLSKRAEEVIRDVIEEAAMELSVSSGVSNARDEARELRIIAERYPSIIKVLEILRERPHYTRELLDKLNTWGYGLEEVRRCEYYGLIKREWGDCDRKSKFRRRCLWNYITERGLRLLALIEGEEE
mgnify:CR=1 FL=1